METNNKLREALENVAKQLIDATEDKNFGEDVMYLVGCMRTMSRKCRAALAEPVKNCEVGTVEQQAKRFEEYCEAEVCKRKRCKSRAKALCIERCALEWAQMPYEEGDVR